MTTQTVEAECDVCGKPVRTSGAGNFMIAVRHRECIPQPNKSEHYAVTQADHDAEFAAFLRLNGRVDTLREPPTILRQPRVPSTYLSTTWLVRTSALHGYTIEKLP